MTYIFDIPQVRKSQALLDFVVNVTYLVTIVFLLKPPSSTVSYHHYSLVFFSLSSFPFFFPPPYLGNLKSIQEPLELCILKTISLLTCGGVFSLDQMTCFGCF